MNKIKILKDIPGASKGDIFEYNTFAISHVVKLKSNTGTFKDAREFVYKPDWLIKEGYAEEVKEIDIEEIRDRLELSAPNIIFTNAITNISFRETNSKELQWFSAYRIVSEVIKQLNQTYVFPSAEALCENAYEQTEIYWCEEDEIFYADLTAPNKKNILPVCYSEEIAKKVIDLCTPELLILFNVK